MIELGFEAFESSMETRKNRESNELVASPIPREDNLTNGPHFRESGIQVVHATLASLFATLTRGGEIDCIHLRLGF